MRQIVLGIASILLYLCTICCLTQNTTMNKKIVTEKDSAIKSKLDLSMRYDQIVAALGAPETIANGNLLDEKWHFDDKTSIVVTITKDKHIIKNVKFEYEGGVPRTIKYSAVMPLPTELKSKIIGLDTCDSIEKILGPPHEHLGYGIDYKKWYFSDHSSLRVTTWPLGEDNKIRKLWKDNDISFDKFTPW